MTEHIDKAIFLRALRVALKSHTSGRFNSLLSAAAEELVNSGTIKLNSNALERIRQHSHDIILIDDKNLGRIASECCQYLMAAGILYPEPNIRNYNNGEMWLDYYLSDFGKQWVASNQEPIPEDALGYIQFLKSAIPNFDPAIYQYVSEALGCLDRGLFFAAAVMLGAASEKIIYLLGDALVKKCSNPAEVNKLQGLMNSRRLHEFSEKVISLLDTACKNKTIPFSVHEESLPALETLLDALRIQRNNAVHPIGGKVTLARLRLLFAAFPLACLKAYDFIQWLDKNSL